MKSLMARTGLAVTATAFFLAPPRCDAIDLRLQPAKPSFRADEPITIRVLVINPVESAQTLYLKRIFWLVPQSSPQDGDLGLSIEVKGPDGATLRSIAPGMIVVPVRTEPEMFLRMSPGDIFGSEITLTGRWLQYKMGEPGRYQVKARLTAWSARKWLDAWRISNPGAEPQFKREDLFEGPVSSEPLDILITGGTPPLATTRQR